MKIRESLRVVGLVAVLALVCVFLQAEDGIRDLTVTGVQTCALPISGMWGVAAGVLHFVPYLGSALVAVGAGLAAFVQFGSLFWGIAVGALSLVIAGVVGFVFMTWLHSRFARVNTAVLFIALLFFGWLWGMWGLLLGAPLVAIAKVVFDRVESLKPAGELLGQ